MAEVIRYVDPDATGGGTGVDWTNAYISLFAWEAAEQTDLVSDGDWHHVYCRASSGSADTVKVTFSGWTGNATTNYVHIEAASGDEALKTGIDTSRYRLSPNNNDALVINNTTIKIILDKIQFNISGNGSDHGIAISNAGDITLHVINCYNNIAVSSGTQYGVYVLDGSATHTVEIWNTIIKGWNTTSSAGVYNNNATSTINVYNSIIYDCISGVQEAQGTINIYNSAIFNCTDDFNSISGTINYNASDDGDGINAVSPSGADWDNEYTDSANGDFTLLNTGNTYHGGADNPSSGLYTTDIEGDAYNSGAYSIGVDEIVSGGTTHQLSGSINSSSQITGTLNLTQRISGTLNTSSNTSGVLRLIQRLTGSLNSSSVVSGTIRLIHGLKGFLQSVSEVIGKIKLTQRIRGTINSISTLTGRLNLLQRISGLLNSKSNLSGNLTITGAPVTHQLSGSINSSSLLSGNLTIVGAVTLNHPLSATIKNLSPRGILTINEKHVTIKNLDPRGGIV